MTRRGGLDALVAAAIGLLVAADAEAQQRPATAVPRPAATTKAKAPPAPKAILEPRALEILKAASDRLAGARSMTFNATVTYEYPSRLGPPLAFTTLSRVAMQRPDKLLVVTPGDGAASELYVDGRTVMAYAPAENLVAVAEGSFTIETALELVFHASGTYYPFTDLIVADPYAALGDGLKNAFYVGRSETVGGVATDMIVYSTPELFVQAWIGVDDKLPRRLRATFAKDPHQLRHQLDVADWRLDAIQPPETFVSSKASGAARVAFARPSVPPQAKPTTTRKSSPAATTKTP